MKNTLKKFFTVFLLEDVVSGWGKVGRAHIAQWIKSQAAYPANSNRVGKRLAKRFPRESDEEWGVLLSERCFPRFYLD
jgi:hypothetical protein